MIENNIFIKSSYGEQLAATISRASNVKSPLVIMCPGFTSNRKNSTNTEMSRRLTSKGISTLMLDLSGHGDSEGDISNQTIIKASHEIETVVNECFKYEWVDKSRIALMGASFSANAMIIYAEKNDKLKGLALKSPITDYIGTRIHHLGKDAMELWKENGIIKLNSGIYSKYQFYLDALEIDTYELIKKIKPPLFIVQGDNDEDILESHIAKLKMSLNEKDTLKIIKGATHTYNIPEHYSEMINLLEDFLVKILLLS